MDISKQITTLRGNFQIAGLGWRMLRNISGTPNGPMKIMKTRVSLLDGVQVERLTMLSYGLVSIACCSPVLGFVQFVSHRVNCHIVQCIFVHKIFIALGTKLH